MIKKLAHKKVIVPTMLTLGVIFLGLLSVSYASAQEEGRYPSIVQKIAQKFNLNEKDVQAVFDEERESRYADMQARWSERLDDLVNEGKITNDQRDKILKKHEEMHSAMQELTDLSPEERRTKMKEVHENLKYWAEKEGIDLSFLGSFRYKFNGPNKGLGNKFIFHERFDEN